MYLLDSNFFTALPAIILGMICMGVVCFLIFGLISKASGRSIGYRGGILHKGGTLADPDMLDKVGSEIRKTFDKKYRNKKQIQEEYAIELQKAIYPIDQEILMITSNSMFLSLPVRNTSEKKSTKFDGLRKILEGSPDMRRQIDKRLEELNRQKAKIIGDLKSKYALKLSESNNYL